MLSSKLKDIANKHGVFVMSSTQLNADWKDSEIPDQNLLRGAKSIADRIDIGMILLQVTPEDLAKLEPVLTGSSFEAPTLKISIYKNRRGIYRGCYLWCKADLGTCRIEPMFCTTWHFEMLSIDNIRVIVEDEPAPWENS